MLSEMLVEGFSLSFYESALCSIFSRAIHISHVCFQHGKSIDIHEHTHTRQAFVYNKIYTLYRSFLDDSGFNQSLTDGVRDERKKMCISTIYNIHYTYIYY